MGLKGTCAQRAEFQLICPHRATYWACSKCFLLNVEEAKCGYVRMKMLNPSQSILLKRSLFPSMIKKTFWITSFSGSVMDLMKMKDLFRIDLVMSMIIGDPGTMGGSLIAVILSSILPWLERALIRMDRITSTWLILIITHLFPKTLSLTRVIL